MNRVKTKNVIVGIVILSIMGSLVLILGELGFFRGRTFSLARFVNEAPGIFIKKLPTLCFIMIVGGVFMYAGFRSQNKKRIEHEEEEHDDE